MCRAIQRIKFYLKIVKIQFTALLFSRIDSISLFEQYIYDPKSFWIGTSLRHAEKIEEIKENFFDAGYRDEMQIVKSVFEKVIGINKLYDRPFFVMGPGGSGTTWLGAMLGDFNGFCYGGEIYIPQCFRFWFYKNTTCEIKDLFNAIMLFHTWGRNNLHCEYAHNFVNSARSIYDYHLLKKIWPKGRFIWIARDPRDQICCVTFRKNSYRQKVAPKHDDKEYMRLNAKKFRKIYNKFKKIPSKDIFVVKYENLKCDTEKELAKIANYFGINLRKNAIKIIASNHNAGNMRSGRVPFQGNLDEGGSFQDWKKIMSKSEIQMVLPYVKEALNRFRYD